MERLKLVVLAFVAFLLIAAATAGVTRQEFKALKTEVATLKFSITTLAIEVKALRQPVAQVPPVVQPKAAEQLKGRDLLAWKLAKQRAEKEWQFKMGGRHVSKISVHTGEKLLPGPAILSKPTTEYMRRTATNDYIFRFNVIAQRGGQQFLSTIFDIEVVDYGGTKLRIGVVDWIEVH